MTQKRGKTRQTNFFDVCRTCQSYSCCFGTLPPITAKRRRIIEDYLRKEGIMVEDAFVEEEYVFPRVKADGYCVFHDARTRKCLIHPVKPETCVAGPVTFDINKNTGKLEWFIKFEKICQLAGVVYRDKILLENHLKAAKKEIQTLVKELSARELKAILCKDEPETFKIGED
ncbi:MAG: YkgJ family cysteine cluster protein [Candidatus Bathyarchaeia archaeon]